MSENINPPAVPENIYPVVMLSGPDGKAIAEAFFRKETITLGRGEENDICVMDPAMKISREHLRLEKRNNQVYLYDLSSRNGTLLNGRRIDSEPACFKLTPSDEVKIGEYTLRVYSSVSPSAQKLVDEKGITIAETLELPMRQEKTSSPLPEVKVAEKEPMVSAKLADIADMPSPTQLIRRNKLAALTIQPELEEPKTSMITMPRIVLVLAIIGGIGWYLGWWKNISFLKNIDSSKQTEDNKPKNATSAGIEVTTFKIEAKTSQNQVLLQGSGYVTVRRQAAINSTIDGELEYILAKPGDFVKVNQILAQLNQANAKVEFERAQTELKMERLACEEIEGRLQEAEKNLQRKRELCQKGLMSKQDLEEAQGEFDALKPKLGRNREKLEDVKHKIRLAKIALDSTFIRAPFDGVVTEKTCEVGESIAKQGKTLFIIIDRSGIGATVDVNESYISKLFEQQKVELILNAYPNKKYEGKVRKLMPAVDKQKSTIQVDIVFTNPNELVLPGMSVRATFFEKALEETKPNQPFKVVISINALQKDGNENYVWLFNQMSSKVEKRKVSLGPISGGEIQIMQGLSEGDEIVLSSTKQLMEGLSVRKLQ